MTKDTIYYFYKCEMINKNDLDLFDRMIALFPTLEIDAIEDDDMDPDRLCTIIVREHGNDNECAQNFIFLRAWEFEEA